jgi:hypothetical protein
MLALIFRWGVDEFADVLSAREIGHSDESLTATSREKAARLMIIGATLA